MSISYQFIAFIPIVILVLVHLFAGHATRLGKDLHGKFLSIGGGIALSYVFVDLMPKLGESEMLIKETFHGFFPYLEKHVYILALLGFLLFFAIDRKKSFFGKKSTLVASLLAYAIFNFFVGYAIADENDPEVQPLILFTIAVGLHYFTNDFSLTQSHGRRYSNRAKWLLIASLLAGWVLGFFFALPPASIALIGAFIGGGIIMNVVRHELPRDNPNSLEAFALSAIAYSIILLFVGV